MSIHQPYATARHAELRADAEHRRVVTEVRRSRSASKAAEPAVRVRRVGNVLALFLRPAA